MLVIRRKLYTEINNKDSNLVKTVYGIKRANQHIANASGWLQGKTMKGITRLTEILANKNSNPDSNIKKTAISFRDATNKFLQQAQEKKDGRTKSKAADEARKIIFRAKDPRARQIILKRTKNNIYNKFPGGYIDDVIRFGVRYPIYGTSEIVNDAVALGAGVAGGISGGLPGATVGFVEGNALFPGRIIGATGEALASSMPGYSSSREAAKERYKNSKMSHKLRRANLRNLVGKTKEAAKNVSDKIEEALTGYNTVPANISMK